MRRFFTLKYLAIPVLLGLNGYVWYSIEHVSPPQLQVSILNVGQGDSLFIEGPTGVQMLIDGGPDRSVLRQLPKEMSLFDRTLDLVVATHPDKDHIAGLTDVFARYRVSYYLGPGIESTTETAAGLENAVEHEKGIQSFIARRGMRLHLGGGAYADILYPDADVSKIETNEGSISMKIVYGTTSFMFTGDASSEIESHLISINDPNQLHSTVLKAGHHGSKHSTSDVWLDAVDPEFVVISAGENNSYGHPSPEVLARVREQGAEIVSTIDSGTLHFVSDGKAVSLK
jgi:competence protein ComEC